ncbi:Uncharacterized protein HZ326_22549 [Fusarium oxysporum f. sp. albedinis]|nr:Uncharacterized protein HZ326_22549 [Fusarium oxysporum f. sp. albedinis]
MLSRVFSRMDVNAEIISRRKERSGLEGKRGPLRVLKIDVSFHSFDWPKTGNGAGRLDLIDMYRPAQAMLSLAKLFQETTVESTRIPSGPSPPFIGLSSKSSDQGVTIFRKQPLSSDHAFVSTPS